MKLDKEQLVALGRECGWTLDIGQAERLAGYVRLLLFWSRKMNLIGPTARDRLWPEHLAPCLWLVNCVRAAGLERRHDAGQAMADLGSGSGLPGLVAACVEPEWELHLFEARRKRVSFLQSVAAELCLEKVTVHWSRVGEESSATPRGLVFDTAMARAVGDPEGLLTPAAALVEPGGELNVLTGPKVARTLAAVNRSDWKHDHQESQELYGRTCFLVVLKRLNDHNGA